MRPTPLLAPLLLCLVQAAPAADDPPGAPDAPTLAPVADPLNEFECDTPAGHFSFWGAPLAPHGTRVSGMLRVNEWRADPRWGATATVQLFIDHGKGPSVRLIRNRADGQWQVEMTDTRTPISQKILGKLAQPSDPVPFTLTLKDGVFAVSVGALSDSEPVAAGEPSRVHLSCSTADVLFFKVSLS